VLDEILWILRIARKSDEKALHIFVNCVILCVVDKELVNSTNKGENKMIQYFNAMFHSIATWFSTDWTAIAAFFAAYPYLIVVAGIAIIGAIAIGLRKPKMHKA